MEISSGGSLTQEYISRHVRPSLRTKHAHPDIYKRLVTQPGSHLPLSIFLAIASEHPLRTYAPMENVNTSPSISIVHASHFPSLVLNKSIRGLQLANGTADNADLRTTPMF
jgi:hypothetical protein